MEAITKATVFRCQSNYTFITISNNNNNKSDCNR